MPFCELTHIPNENQKEYVVNNDLANVDLPGIMPKPLVGEIYYKMSLQSWECSTEIHFLEKSGIIMVIIWSWYDASVT